MVPKVRLRMQDYSKVDKKAGEELDGQLTYKDWGWACMTLVPNSKNAKEFLFKYFSQKYWLDSRGDCFKCFGGNYAYPCIVLEVDFVYIDKKRKYNMNNATAKLYLKLTNGNISRDYVPYPMPLEQVNSFLKEMDRRIKSQIF